MLLTVGYCNDCLWYVCGHSAARGQREAERLIPVSSTVSFTVHELYSDSAG